MRRRRHLLRSLVNLKAAGQEGQGRGGPPCEPTCRYSFSPVWGEQEEQEEEEQEE